MLVMRVSYAWRFVSYFSRITPYHSKAYRYLQSGQARSDELQKPDCGPQSGPAGSYKSPGRPRPTQSLAGLVACEHCEVPVGGSLLNE